MSANYTGFSPDSILGAMQNRFFYGLRRTDQGELFAGKLDQLSNNDTIAVNNPGAPEDNFSNFSEGQDFYEGRDINHEIVYKNLSYEQFRWDDRNIYYYVNAEGELVVRINQKFVYDENSSSSGQ
tara:strand:+ start:1695 stop:2069 length:375 start_codon:yes stop_codon:yes gene_type:complete